MRKEIKKLLYQGGVFQSYRGSAYFEYAVILASEDIHKLQGIRKEIYVPIAEKFNTSVTTVEKDIRTIRDVFMRNNGNDILKEMGFPNCSKYLYPRELIECFAIYLSEEK